MIELNDVAKTFTPHVQGGRQLPVVVHASFRVDSGEWMTLVGPSGAGNSTVMRMVYGNYLAETGSVPIGGLDVAQVEPRSILRLQREASGYVSQFLRVVPRVPTLEVVAEPLRAVGRGRGEAEARARELLARLNVPQSLWTLSPMTFPGGERPRVNIARGFAYDYPALLLDEPTASLDPVNRAVVLDLMQEAKARGAAILGIFHDAAARAQVCDREVDVGAFSPEAAA